jgi:membrane protein DedA with SNARE-associated domain
MMISLLTAACILREHAHPGIGPTARHRESSLSRWSSSWPDVPRDVRRSKPEHALPLFALKVALLAVIARHHHGPTIDYLGLAAAAGASWFGIPGPGEPVLIAAGVVAGRHSLDISSVLAVAFGGAMVGGIVGWLVGMKAGRAVMLRPGPLLRFRRGAVARGDHVFERAPAVAVFLAPTWIAGIHKVGPAVFLPVTVFGAVLWAGGIGLGAYYLGPTIVDVVDDAGLVMGITLVALVVTIIGLDVMRRRRRTGRGPGRPTTGSATSRPTGTEPPAGPR